MSKRASQPKVSPGAPVAALIGALIVVATLVACLPAMSAGFIWDDDSFLTANPFIQAPDGLRVFWFTARAEDYFPLTYSMLWAEWRIWRDHAAGYHVVNILLHAGAALLLWRALKRLNVPAAWLGGLIFAIHPVAISSVAWITERKNTLSMVFYLASLLTYLRFEDSGRKKTYLLALGFFLLALFSKSSVVVLPAALLLCAWWRRGRIGKADAARIAPFLVMGAAFGLLQLQFHSVKFAGNPELVDDPAMTANFVRKNTVPRPERFASRLAASGWAVWFYLYKAALPVRLLMAYPRWEVDPSKPAVWLPLAALIGVFLLLWRCRGSWGRAPLFALGYFVVALGPVLGFFEISLMEYTLVADHWQYIALPGITGLAAGLIGWGWRRARAWRTLIGGGAALMLIALGVLAFRHAAVYKDQETLWRHNLKYNPDFAPGHNNLANMMLMKGDYAGAIKEYEISIRLNPIFPPPYFNLATIHHMLSQGKGLSDAKRRELLDEAIHWYQLRMDLHPDKETKDYMDIAVAERRKLGP
jgi:hypothetical protein